MTTTDAYAADPTCTLRISPSLLGCLTLGAPVVFNCGKLGAVTRSDERGVVIHSGDFTGGDADGLFIPLLGRTQEEVAAQLDLQHVYLRLDVQTGRDILSRWIVDTVHGGDGRGLFGPARVTRSVAVVVDPLSRTEGADEWVIIAPGDMQWQPVTLPPARIWWAGDATLTSLSGTYSTKLPDGSSRHYAKMLVAVARHLLGKQAAQAAADAYWASTGQNSHRGPDPFQSAAPFQGRPGAS